MKYRYLKTKNSEYDTDLMKDLRALYSGGRTLKKRLPELIHLCEQDSDPVKKKKLQIANDSYVNYFAQIISFYPSALFNYPLEIKCNKDSLPEYYSELLENSDHRGVDFIDQLRAVLTESLITGRALLEVIIPEGEEFQSRAEWESSEASRLYLKPWKGEECIDWFYEDNKLKWVKFFVKEYVRKSPTSEELTSYTWTILDENKKSVYNLLLDRDQFIRDDQEISLVYDQEHNLGEIPVVDLFIEEGLHLGKNLRSPAVSNLLSRSALFYALSKQAYSVPVISTDGDISGLNLNNAIKIPQEAKFEWTNSPTEFLTSLSSWVEDTRQELYRVGSRLSYQMSGNSYALIRSAAAREQDKSQDLTIIRYYGSLVREIAKGVLDLISRIRNDELVFSAEGFDQVNDYSLIDYTTIAKSIGETDIGKLYDISETFAKQFKQRIVNSTFLDLDQTVKEKIRAEIEASKRPEPPEDKKPFGESLEQKTE